jgi:hypothetical protein
MKISDRQLTTAELLRVTCIDSANLELWVRQGWLSPSNHAQGQGHYRLWSITQCVGLSVAEVLRHSTRGCRSDYIGLLVHAFDQIQEADLVAMFARGETHFLGLQDERPLLTPKLCEEQPDVRSIYKHVGACIIQEKKRTRAV